MRQKGFAPLILILLIAILGVVGYFGYKNYSQRFPIGSQNSTYFPIATIGTIDAKIFASKDNNPWLIYQNYTYKFSFRFPNTWNASLDSTNMKITAPICEGCGGATEGISVIYLDNSKLLSLENVIISDFNSSDWNKKYGLQTSIVPSNYKKITSTGSNLNIYIDRRAPTAGTEAQEVYIPSSDNKFVLKMFFSQCNSQTVDKILSTISFTE